ncbi:MAG: hypothetical protein PQJ61_16700 [Spirochaetales bacterium]|uniref:Outer membrane protein beta-barrel domain-containing protein n=1 Tax=Candidatus Thalassospirochaeta sargassi TaxID=3119039 RepID=A0AAJ1IFJ5_9SPIO|nr:hypothetical protein [Spirochaetales bacterium]
MKFKFISLAYIILIGTYAFADDINFGAGFSLTPEAHFTEFESRDIKTQTALSAAVFYTADLTDFFNAGISLGYIYALTSNLDGGWSYPGFNGIDLGAEFSVGLPLVKFSPRLGGGLYAGWYRYNFTESYFFLPAAEVFPALELWDNDDYIKIFLEIPFKYYFHNEASAFFSTGIRFKAVYR